MSTQLEIPELSLVVLIGVSGSGKSTFGRTQFLPSEVISSDFCRGLVADDENAQDATNDAFELLHYIAGKRLGRGRQLLVQRGCGGRGRPRAGDADAVRRRAD